MKDFRNYVDSVIRDEHGSITILSLFWIVTAITLGGLAVDFMNRTHSLAKMQTTADAVAHAALVAREIETKETAIANGIILAEGNMPAQKFGNAVLASDIEFGTWDESNATFTLDATSKDAVRATVRRVSERTNIIDNLLLRVIGYTGFEAEVSAVFERYQPSCLREGLVAKQIVDVTSSNIFKSGFCIYAEWFVEVNSYNVFEPNSIVSMPDRSNLSKPADGFLTNNGLQEALRDAYFELEVLERINEYINGVTDPNSEHYRDYITSPVPIYLDSKAKLDNSQFTPGAIHIISCANDKQKAKIHAATLLSNIILYTNCQLMLGENVALENVVIASSNSTTAAISGASGIRFGADDNCAPGGGAQVLTFGEITFPQAIQLHGSQLIAGRDITFTSDANGVEGASIISGGNIRGTTDGTFGFCDGLGMEDNFSTWYFKMVL